MTPAALGASSLTGGVPASVESDAKRPESGRVSAIIAVAIMIVQLLPLLPALLMEAGPPHLPLPAALMAGAPFSVMLILCLQEWTVQPRARLGLFRALAWNAVLAVAVGAISSACIIWLAQRIGWIWPHFRAEAGGPGSLVPLARAVAIGTVTGLFQVGMWAVAFVVPAAIEDEKVKDLEIRGLQLEASEQRARAELALLRGQLEPHFLLNTLNLLSGLMTSDTDRARELLASIGDLLQDAFASRDELQTLGDEIRWLERYIEILQARHGDMLRIKWEIDPAAREARLPRLLLQPLVENAVVHGALRRREGGTITVRAERRVESGAAVLVCTVLDDGPGLGAPRPGSRGLTNVRRRLALNVPGSTFEISRCETATRAVVTIPLLGDAGTRMGEGPSH